MRKHNLPVSETAVMGDCGAHKLCIAASYISSSKTFARSCFHHLKLQVDLRQVFASAHAEKGLGIGAGMMDPRRTV